METAEIKREKSLEDQNVSNTMMRMTKTSQEEINDEKPGRIPEKVKLEEHLSSDDSMVGIDEIPQDHTFYA